MFTWASIIIICVDYIYFIIKYSLLLKLNSPQVENIEEQDFYWWSEQVEWKKQTFPQEKDQNAVSTDRGILFTIAL